MFVASPSLKAAKQYHTGRKAIIGLMGGFCSWFLLLLFGVGDQIEGLTHAKHELLH
jgi:hypothetical protein